MNDAEGPRSEQQAPLKYDTHSDEWNRYRPYNVAASDREYPQPGIDSPNPLITGKQNRRLRTATPEAPSRGVSAAQLAEYQRDLTDYARWRIIVKGADSYTDATGGQRFEEMDITQLGKEYQDEIADAINYLTMLNINVQRMIKAVIEK